MHCEKRAEFLRFTMSGRELEQKAYIFVKSTVNIVFTPLSAAIHDLIGLPHIS